MLGTDDASRCLELRLGRDRVVVEKQVDVGIPVDLARYRGPDEKHRARPGLGEVGVRQLVDERTDSPDCVYGRSRYPRPAL